MSTLNIVELNTRTFANTKEQANPVKSFLHDIRSPLQALQALVSVQSLSDEERNSMYESCMKRIASLTGQKNEEKRSEEKEVCIANLFNSIKKQKELELGCQISTSANLLNPWLKLPLSTSEIENILSNLINNSINASSRNISIKARLHKNFLKIEVIDTGKGIEASKISKIGQVGQTYTEGGQGLGLTNTIKLLKSIGGDLSCRSIPNVITQFTISIPL
ncbi:HAMP domain-containing sensor histidine kinase [Bacteriovorax sp. Seq25_V]|uniref:sensor histidine kinase n=1 Tax=Bacteriovorax sp. Seq25_V TaxID=1201288 RepID=UPI000389DA17|nr:sensor histidine kinase [Bacteriovorax sp. Seq25_V]EQC44716.1 GHKL domain protein [Bacteriovorax sp. Seq25_V]